MVTTRAENSAPGPSGRMTTSRAPTPIREHADDAGEEGEGERDAQPR